METASTTSAVTVAAMRSRQNLYRVDFMPVWVGVAILGTTVALIAQSTHSRRDLELRRKLVDVQRDRIRSTRHRARAGLLASSAYSGQQASPWLVVIAVLLVVGALYLASSLFIPLTIALLAYLTLRPMTTRLGRLGLPRPIAAGIIIAGCFSLVAFVTTLLYSPMQSWLDRAPASVGRLRQNLDVVAQPLTTLDRAEEELEEAGDEVGANRPELEVSVKKPGFIDRDYLINTTGSALAFIGAIAVLAFFMLSSGDELLNRILNVLPRDSQRREVLATIGEIQDNVGSYLSHITYINVGLGVAVSVVMWLVGMPTPVLWGVMAALLNFIPYIGPLGGTVLVLVAAASTFESFTRALGTAGAFWLTTAIEGQFITPAIIGKTLRVGSLVVLVAVAFWGFLWGLPGIFLAVPLLIVQRTVFASFDATYPLAVILGENARDAGHPCEPVHDDERIAEIA